MEVTITQAAHLRHWWSEKLCPASQVEARVTTGASKGISRLLFVLKTSTRKSITG